MDGTTRLRPLREITEFLPVSYQRAADLARQNIIPTIRLGRKLYFVPEQIETFIANGGKALAGGWRREAPGA